MQERAVELFPAGSVGLAVRPKPQPALSKPTCGLCSVALKVPEYVCEHTPTSPDP